MQTLSRKLGHTLERTLRVPAGRWQRVRKRLHDFIWPTDEEATEYLRILRNLEREDWLRRGRTDAALPHKRGNPPHDACPCDLCSRYWQGFWAQL